jgi:hypothetical protein
MADYRGPSIPTVYDPNWGGFDNLTPSQILWFESQPQDLIKYTNVRRSAAEQSGTSVTFTPTGAQAPVTIPLNMQGDSKVNAIGMRQGVHDGLLTQISFIDNAGNVQTVDVAGAKAVHQAMFGFVAALNNAAATLINGVNAKTVTSRTQIDTAFAAIAPNSPSAQVIKGV